MKISQAHIIQSVSLLIIQSVALFFLALTMPGVAIYSLWSAIAIVLVISLIEGLVWWGFIQFFAHLPIFLYPVFTFALTGIGIALAGNEIPGIRIDGIVPAIWIAVILTVINAILGSLFSLDEEASFDKNVTRRMIEKHGKPEKTDVPAFLFLEIDGLSHDTLEIALAKGFMPTLKSWLDSGSHKLTSWETDFTSQTGAMQSGILLGNNKGVPSYRWWDRKHGKIVMSGNPLDASHIEKLLSNGKGLLAGGGASRGNMFSGDATESLFTMSSLLNKDRKGGPGFYFYLVNPFVIARLITRFFLEVFKEWFAQLINRGKIISSRTPAYAFLRGFMGPFLQDLTTYAVINDVMRGVPAVYALFAGYDDLGHFTGMHSKEAFKALAETDRYFSRIVRAMQYAPRPYHIVVLSDHGQSQGPIFETAHGISLGHLVKDLIKGEVFAAINTNEAFDNLNAVLSESTQGNSRGARFVRRALLQKTKDGVVQFGPDRDQTFVKKESEEEKTVDTIVLGSGCTGLIYFKHAKKRLTFEEIEKLHPQLISGLANHPGIGFVVVKSKTKGTLVLGKAKDPLKDFGPHAKEHINRESAFDDCADIVVSTRFDPKTEELCGFENQLSHHGGLGGPQTRPFLLYPSTLTLDNQPIIGATQIYKVLRQWRNDGK